MASIEQPTVSARLWWWIPLCGAAEFLGIAAAALWYGLIAVAFGEPSNIVLRSGVWLLMTAAAVPEGFVLGRLQAWGLSWFFPNIVWQRFVVATVVVGLLGWGVGTFIPLFLVGDGAEATQQEPSLFAVAAFASIFGALAGALFGAAQAWAVPTDWRGKLLWVAANVAGWAIALPLIYVAAQMGADLTSTTAKVLSWAAGGGAAGLVIGAATALAIQRMHPEVGDYGLSAIRS